jgi:hypothetical protein
MKVVNSDGSLLIHNCLLQYFVDASMEHFCNESIGRTRNDGNNSSCFNNSVESENLNLSDLFEESNNKSSALLKRNPRILNNEVIHYPDIVSPENDKNNDNIKVVNSDGSLLIRSCLL